MRRTAAVLSTMTLTALASSSAFLAPAQAVDRGPVTTSSTVHQIECEWGITGTDNGLTFGTSYVVGVDTPTLEARVVGEDGIQERGFQPFTWGSALDESVQLTTPDRTPTGTVRVRAALRPGETTVEQIDERDGNLHTTGTLTTTAYEMRVDEARYSAGHLTQGRCEATVMVWNTTSNDPQYHRTHSHELDADPCTLQGMKPSQIYVHGPYAEPHYSLRVHRGSTVWAADGELRRSGARADASGKLRTMDTDEVKGSAKTTVRFARAGRPTVTREVDGATTTVTRRVPTTMRITVRTSAGEVGRVDCAAVETETWTSTKRW